MAPITAASNTAAFGLEALGQQSLDPALQPMSRTHQYRKVMKPLLERKRRARINKCLDDMKDIMVEAFHTEGESITKLEKADVLELTVRHLQKLRRQQMLQTNPAIDVDRYRAGFTACANEVSRFLSTVPGVSLQFGTGLMSHLGSRINDASEPDNDVSGPLSVNTASSSSSGKAPSSTLSPSSDCGYNSGRDSTPSPALSVGQEVETPAALVDKKEPSCVWRPF